MGKAEASGDGGNGGGGDGSRTAVLGWDPCAGLDWCTAVMSPLPPWLVGGTFGSRNQPAGVIIAFGISLCVSARA